MTPQVYLIAPADAAAAEFAPALRHLLAMPGAAALLLPRGRHNEDAYGALVRAVAPDAQARGLAVLVEGPPALVRELGVDGLHVAGPTAAVRDAVAALKPDFVVGAGDVRSRHDAMQKGEFGIDYILFGPLSGPISVADRDLARWWAETMEIPGVLSDPEAASPDVDAAGCEFVGLNIASLETVR